MGVDGSCCPASKPCHTKGHTACFCLRLEALWYLNGLVNEHLYRRQTISLSKAYVYKRLCPNNTAWCAKTLSITQVGFNFYKQVTPLANRIPARSFSVWVAFLSRLRLPCGLTCLFLMFIWRELCDGLSIWQLYTAATSPPTLTDRSKCHKEGRGGDK